MEKGWLFPGFLLNFLLMFSLLCEGTGTDSDCECAGVAEVVVSGLCLEQRLPDGYVVRESSTLEKLNPSY